MKYPSLVLLIDDDEISNFVTEAILKNNIQDSEIKSFSDPSEALSFLIKNFQKYAKPILIFLDINMPQMTGWEVLTELEKLSELNNSVEVVMTSSSIDENDKKNALENPRVINFIAKPISNEFVKSLISKE